MSFFYVSAHLFNTLLKSLDQLLYPISKKVFDWAFFDLLITNLCPLKASFCGPNTWLSEWARSGLYGRCCKIYNLNRRMVSIVTAAIWGHALSHYESEHQRTKVLCASSILLAFSSNIVRYWALFTISPFFPTRVQNVSIHIPVILYTPSIGQCQHLL